MKIYRVLIIGGVLAVLLSLPFFGRSWNRLMHLVGAVLFMGNIVATALWASLARRHGDPEVMRLCARGIVLTDAVLTFPGVLLLFLNGGLLGVEWFRAGASWIILSVVLFTVTGIVWGAALVPVQRRLLKVLEAMPRGGPVPPECDRLLGRWFRWGGIALLLPAVILVLMVFKPIF